jgi:hypothetical protein
MSTNKLARLLGRNTYLQTIPTGFGRIQILARASRGKSFGRLMAACDGSVSQCCSALFQWAFQEHENQGSDLRNKWPEGEQ